MDNALPSDRELEVLSAYMRFGSVSATAAFLCVSVGTVNCHLEHLREKAGLEHRVQLVVHALRVGWVNGTP
ncbi:MAG: helix-turn-helix domain-containing protein [Armatimonadetes bacterium]|jgi:DNA-binding CsgD family transcriptional regulator|nr:helix-turn-helix domain-containing protein [Armatimonadota bacterium]